MEDSSLDYEIKENANAEATVVSDEDMTMLDSVTQDVPPVEQSTKKILHFVDVFQQEYEVEINPNVSANEYDNAFFVRDGNKLKYEDKDYFSRMGIDISRHQGDIDWDKVKEYGVEFAFIRVGYRGYGKAGSIHLDERFHKNISEAQKAGIDVGVYFFSQAISDDEAREEAEFVLDAIGDYDIQLTVVYDPESILDAVARTDNVTGEQFTRNTEIFCEMIRQAGYRPMIYSNMLWEAYELDLEQLSDYPIWYADYENYPQTPYAFEFWQYTNEGVIPGISGTADLDIQMIKK
jgi:GH25 family lysozyme M1 (1,4-beta-N-acetylmuramidase)